MVRKTVARSLGRNVIWMAGVQGALLLPAIAAAQSGQKLYNDEVPQYGKSTPTTYSVNYGENGKFNMVRNNGSDTNPYGLKEAHQKIDKDQIKTYIEQEVGVGDKPLEESEAAQILDEFEKKFNIFIADRDVLAISGLDGKSLVNALQNTVNNSNSSNTLRAQTPDGYKKAIIYSKYMDKTGYLEGRAQAGLTGGPTNPNGTPANSFSTYKNGADNKSAAYDPNGNQQNAGITRDYRAVGSGAPGTSQQPMSYAELQKKRNENPFYMNEPTLRDIHERTAVAYSNGQARFDAQGNELHPNGKRKVNDAGTPLYSNGKPKVDAGGNPIHSNGAAMTTVDGRPAYANGQAKVSLDGTPLFRDGKRKASVDGRQLYANGRAASTQTGAQLHPNAQRKYTGDGIGALTAPTTPLATALAGTAPPRVDGSEKPLYSNGKPATDDEGNQLYENGRRRANDKGDFLYKNGQRMLTNSDVALNTKGGAVAATVGPQGRAHGEFKLFAILHGTVVKNDSKWLEIKPKGQTETIKISVDRAKVGRSSATSPAAPGAIDEIGVQAAVELIVTGNYRFVDGQEVERTDTNQAVGILASSPRVGTQPVKSNKRQVVEVVAGRVRNYSDNVLHLEVTGGKTESMNIEHAVYQKQGSDGPIPVDANALLRAGARVDVVVNRTYEYENGKPVKQLQPTALALMGK